MTLVWVHPRLGEVTLSQSVRARRVSISVRATGAVRLSFPRGVSIRASRTKWGSCSGCNHISLSLFLMTLPEHLRDYVIIHELCHTVHHNHSPRFHALVDRLVGGCEKALNKELRAFTIR